MLLFVLVFVFVEVLVFVFVFVFVLLLVFVLVLVFVFVFVLVLVVVVLVLTDSQYCVPAVQVPVWLLLACNGIDNSKAPSPRSAKFLIFIIVVLVNRPRGPVQIE